jgi:hypothetical protein
MSKPDWSVEKSELERVAQEYRDRGYEVFLDPSVAELPDFVREYRPDMIAKSANECLVIEVRQLGSPADRERMKAIAGRVESRPGWKFVLVAPLQRPETNTDDLPRVMGIEQVEKLLDEVDTLRRANHTASALLLGWAAFEAAMRFAAQQEAPDVSKPDTWMLMRELVSRGILDRDRYHDLMELFKLRSVVAHGFQPPQASNEVVFERALDVLSQSTKDLLADLKSIS